MLAEKIMLVCAKYYVPCILHSFSGAAIRLNADAVHLPLPLLRKMTEREKASFKHIGTSCHSLAEAEEAETLGCTYLITGHIFDTDCKRNIPSRGLAFLSEICSKAKIPVYAIGGINRLNISSVTEAGAAGACVMSGLMGCENVRLYMEELKSG